MTFFLRWRKCEKRAFGTMQATAVSYIHTYIHITRRCHYACSRCTHAHTHIHIHTNVHSQFSWNAFYRHPFALTFFNYLLQLLRAGAYVCMNTCVPRMSNGSYFTQTHLLYIYVVLFSLRMKIQSVAGMQYNRRILRELSNCCSPHFTFPPSSLTLLNGLN